MTDLPYVLLDDSLSPGGRSLLFTAPEEVVFVHDPAEVKAALEKISAGLARGLHAAGYFGYGFGYCLEPKLKISCRGTGARRSSDRTVQGAASLSRRGDARLARCRWRGRSGEDLELASLLDARGIR